jgi:hypothetical protein
MARSQFGRRRNHSRHGGHRFDLDDIMIFPSQRGRISTGPGALELAENGMPLSENLLKWLITISAFPRNRVVESFRNLPSFTSG